VSEGWKPSSSGMKGGDRILGHAACLVTETTLLFHISEESDIGRFEPRASEYTSEFVVWAIDSDHLHNYLVPRDCPRVTYYAGPKTNSADVERFLGSSRAVVAVEAGWLERFRSCRLYCYHMRPEPFECLDQCAGYFVSREPVVPASVEVFDDPMAELLKRGVELRLMSSLWHLRDAVVASSLQFSCIRMRNAMPRTQP
jgi:uncharacterized protein DUF6886